MVPELMEVEATIEGAARLTEADFLKASAHLPVLKWTRTYGLLVPAMWVVVAGTASATMAGTPGLAEALPLVLSGSLTFGVSVLLLRVVPRSWAKRASADAGVGNLDFRVDAQGLSVNSALRRAQLAWPAISGYAESQSAFIVYTSPQTVFVIPKRAFEDTDLGRVRQLFSERLPPRRGASRPFLRLALGGILVVAFLAIWQMLSLEQPP
jgi:hypothetical protein